MELKKNGKFSTRSQSHEIYRFNIFSYFQNIKNVILYYILYLSTTKYKIISQNITKLTYTFKNHFEQGA